MDIASLFTQSKWEILSQLAIGKYSPLELSKKLNTSIANISQQLRLLEMAGLVRKEKVPQREAGKPRTLYFLADDFGYIILLAKDCASKRLVPLSEHHKIVLRIWQVSDVSLHYYLEKFFWRAEPYLEAVRAMAVDTRGGELAVYVVSDSKEIERKLQDVQIKNPKGESKSLVVKVVSEKELGTTKLPADKMTGCDILHDPSGILKMIQQKMR